MHEIEKDIDGKTVVMIDASCLKNGSCGRELFWDIVEGYRKPGEYNDTFLGSCFHKFRAVFRETKDEWMAIAAARKMWVEKEKDIVVRGNKKYISKTFLQNICLDYASKYQNDTYKIVIDPATDTPLIEPKTRFAFPFIVEPDIDILVLGTMDELNYNSSDNRWDGGCGYNIDDCKCSGAYNSYAFVEDYILNPQLLLYRFAIRKYAQMQPNSIWSKIDTSPNVTARIDGVFYRAPKENADPDKPTVEFRRGKPIIFTNAMLVEFEQLLLEKCWKLINHIRLWKKAGIVPPREGILTNRCGDRRFDTCKYCEACMQPDKESMEAVLERVFIKKQYNPLTWG